MPNEEARYTIESLGGNCPVQAEGRIGSGADVRYFYFRARWDHWRLDIGSTLDKWGLPDPVEWTYSEDYGDPADEGAEFAAGFMSEDEARGFIDKAIQLYLSQKVN